MKRIRPPTPVPQSSPTPNSSPNPEDDKSDAELIVMFSRIISSPPTPDLNSNHKSRSNKRVRFALGS
jgi:hypothetical protein